MSNKRNPRRRRQQVRSEISRKSKMITKSMAAVFAAIPAKRERKERERERKRYLASRELENRRFFREHAWKARKPRTIYGHTFWRHSHDV